MGEHWNTGTQSQMAEYFDRYLEEHPDKTKANAVIQTVLNAIGQVMTAGAAGAISPGVLGGGASVLSSLNYRNSNTESQPANVNTVAQQGQKKDFSAQISNFETAVQSLKLDDSEAQGVIETYAGAAQAGYTQDAAKLNTVVKRAVAQISEIAADLDIAQTEMKAGLQATYDAMMDAELAGNQKAYNAVAIKYKAEFEIVRKKNEIAKLKAENKVNAVYDAIIETAMSLQEKVNSTILQAKKEFEGAGEKPKAGEPDDLGKANNGLRNEDGATGDRATEGADDVGKPIADGIIRDGSQLENGKLKPNNESVLRNKNGAIDDLVTEGSGDTIDGLKITDGKVGGKIPIDDFRTIRHASIKNPDADSITLGRYTSGADSYIRRAETDSSYFDLGSDWGRIKKQYDFTDSEMFNYFNVLALENAITLGKTIRFSHNPFDNRKSFLYQEWKYIKERMGLSDADLVLKGGFWYVG